MNDDKTISPEDDLESLNLSNWSLVDLIKMEAEARRQSDALKKEASGWEKIYDFLSIRVIPTRMEDEGTESLKVTGVGRVNLRGDMWTKTVDPHGLQSWLREHQMEDLIVPAVNGSTLKAFIKEQSKLRDGLQIPTELVEVTPYTRAVITKN